MRKSRPGPRPSVAEPLEARRLLTRYVYVDPGSTGATQNGTSWTNAYTSLQTALANSVSGDQIRVAAGVYKPTTGTSRTSTFQLRNGVDLYGGYAGHLNPAYPDAHDISLYATTLSGDIGTPNNPSDNSYHVLTNSGSSATVDGFTITGGNANGTGTNEGAGGGLLATGGTAYFRNCTFVANTAATRGGAVYRTGFVDIECCVFRLNRSTGTTAGGGAIYGGGGDIANCAFFANSSAAAGGAIYFASISSSTFAPIRTCLFVGNVAATNGGAIYNTAASPTIANSTFAGNAAAVGGGFSLHNAAGSAPTVLNCILWDPTPIANSSSTPSVTYSDVRGGYTTNLNKDPQFTRAPSAGADGSWGTPDDDYGDLRPLLTSPVIDAGSNSSNAYFTSYDYAGNARRYDVPAVADTGSGTAPIVDMGAYEARRGATWYVDAAATGTGAGTSWDDAFLTLQAALAASVGGDEVRVAAGTYKPTTGTDRNASFQLKDNVHVVGGYAGHLSPANPDRRDVTRYPTVLSGDIGVAGDRTDNSFHVVTGTGVNYDTVFEGFTITGGYGAASGGAIFDGLFTIRDCTFVNNSADNGGALYNPGPVFNCLFFANSATTTGGAIYGFLYTSPVTGSVFVGNTANTGAAVYTGSGSGSGRRIANCTFTANIARTTGGGAVRISEGVIVGCVVWGNVNGEVANTSTGKISYSDIQGTTNLAGTGVINLDPKFTRAPSRGLDNTWGTPDDDYGDLRPQLNSPLIDAGDSSVTAGSVYPMIPELMTDAAGRTRRVDIATVADSGVGSAPVIDIGAYEAALDVMVANPGGSLYVQLSADELSVQVWQGTSPIGAPAATYPARSVGLLTLSTTAGGSAILDFANGSLPNVSFSHPGAATLVLANVPAGSAVDLAADGRVSVGTTVVSLGANDTVMFDISTDGSLSLGALTVEGRMSLPANRHATLRTTGLSIGAASTLDIADSDVLIDYTGASPLAAIRAALLAGRNGGAWNGAGIVSLTARKTANGAIGYAEAAELGLTTFAGQPVDGTALLLKYTLAGDATLDGRVNGDDLALADRGKARGLGVWVSGDFDYDGVVTAADYAVLYGAVAPVPATVAVGVEGEGEEAVGVVAAGVEPDLVVAQVAVPPAVVEGGTPTLVAKAKANGAKQVAVARHKKKPAAKVVTKVKAKPRVGAVVRNASRKVQLSHGKSVG